MKNMKIIAKPQTNIATKMKLITKKLKSLVNNYSLLINIR